MSLRLLPGFMDNDDDDDGNFTKWMSSYWGHGAEAAHSRDRKSSLRRSARTPADRRASLPTVSQLDAMKLSRLHAATMAASPSHVRTREEKGEVKPHQRARRVSSDENSRCKTAIQEKRISTIPELTESFEKRLLLRDKRVEALNDEDKLCLMCEEELLQSGGTRELHCGHRFHKEAGRRAEQRCRPRRGSEAAAWQVRGVSDERRSSEDGHISAENEPHAARRQLSLRRHR
ncbi:leukemia NUP98 fusion partner 1 [Cottoperca gobio]|uniref:Leukemia NUP98 fusion partner 1 n=1 Tax=Cottoperca gobio TaxID=56716 RepID=A0A6J2PKX1_COTGO|nr:leukemia NUP98 fusion partner 1 [Cottoperca gobio]